MIDPKASQKGQSATASGLDRFGGLDQLDWLMIVASVLLGTIAKQHQLLDLPDWFLEWVFPFVLMVFGYRAHQKVTELVQSRRERSKDIRKK
jgi:hypothetical protein